jgi:hypothetical protein
MRGRAAMVALPTLVVVALVALVAIASTGSTPGGSDETRPPSKALYDALFSIGLVAVVIGGVLLLYGLMQRKAIANEVASGKYRRTGLLGFLLFFAVFTAVVYRGLSRWEVAEQPPENELAFPERTVRPTLPEGAEETYTAAVSGITIAILVTLAIAAIVAFVVAERRSRRGRHPGPVVLAEQLANVFDDTLDDLRAEADPRRAIIAAYARVERVLGANGIARRPAETSDEYLARILNDLELEPAAIGRLTDLFTRAKFSHHEVDVTMKEEAISALEQVRDELREDKGATRATHDDTPAPVGATS